MENAARTFRRAKLAAEIQRRRHSLYAMRFAQENSTSATLKDHATKRVKELCEELEEMEREYHALNVEQIRDELANG
jgi:hypothetical protein